ncbi:MAG: N-acetylmuramoyl-L-alanine amidase [Eubacteriales bacterium]|nr:N-acetylmuramoyl-L-alanine amidase [Eubacteriales bacterium]
MRRFFFLLCLATLLLLTLPGKNSPGATPSSYRVQTGDNLYRISQKFGVTVEELKKANALQDNTIYAGQVLQIPASSQLHVVQTGENLFRIARRYGLTAEALKAANNLCGDIIHPGQQLVIPEAEGEAVATATPAGNFRVAVTPEDIYLLARLIYAEARGEEYLGQVAVGAVIVNRLLHPRFPKTIRDIIFEKHGSVYQFTPVQNNTINLKPDEQAIRAAQEALQGRDPSGGALFFYNPKKTSDPWIKSLPVTRVIGNHVFARDK